MRMLMLWDGVGDTGDSWHSAWVNASLIPSRGSTNYQWLLASLEHPWVLGGLKRRKELSHSMASALII